MNGELLADARDGVGDDERVDAYAEIPGGSIIRLVSDGGDDRWTERVEVGTPGEWICVHEGTGLKPTGRYNELVETFTTD